MLYLPVLQVYVQAMNVQEKESISKNFEVCSVYFKMCCVVSSYVKSLLE